MCGLEGLGWGDVTIAACNFAIKDNWLLWLTVIIKVNQGVPLCYAMGS